MSPPTKTSTVQTRGIFHGLPTFPSNDPRYSNLTAIITGANGISGHYMLRVLAQAPERWSKIYCLSRRPPAIEGGLPRNAVHIPLDFLKEPVEIGEVLKKEVVKADYVFFFSYIQVPPLPGGGIWSNAEEMSRVNTLLLKNFLEALPLASIQPKRIMLQTGAKNYGIHLGPASNPQEESDPRVLLEPNFYYHQEDVLSNFCAKAYSQPITWTVARPSTILGAVPDAAMNFCFPLGVYAAVCKHLGQPLAWPTDLKAWETPQVQSSAMLNGYLEEWSVLTEEAGNQAFNSCDDCAWTWGKFWDKLAARYGVEAGKPDLDDSAYMEVKLGHEVPPRGFGPPGKIHFKFTLANWAKRPEVNKAWKEIADKNSLVVKELREPDRIFGFADGTLAGAAINFSMSKARKMGWHGFVDTEECIYEVLEDFVKLKMLPPIPPAK